MTSPEPRPEVAIALHRAGRLAEAERAYRSFLEQHPRSAQGFHLLGLLLQQAGHPEHALEPLRRAIELAPEQPAFHAALGRALFSMSHVHDAVAPLRRAAELAPGAAAAWCDLGTVLQDTGDRAQARAAYERALALEPNNTTARFNLAILARESGDLARAIGQLLALLADTPDAVRAHTVLAGYLLEAGRVDEADRHCREVLARSPRDLMAMTFASVVCCRRGDDAGARQWVDLQRFVQVTELPTPTGYADLAGFNDALERHVLAHPTLEHERVQNATRNGAHTDNLLRDPQPGPMADLAAQLDAAVGRYLASLPHDPSHPYLSRRPTGWRLQAWAVVMRSQGHQLAHTHPDGWVSGVYYPRVPTAVCDDDPRQRGWIEFGRPLPELLADAAPQVRRIRPQEGRLVLFPSFVYHETVPFDAPEPRISIAFDAVPRW